MTIDHQLVASLWPLRFPGKVRLLDPLVPRQGTRRGRVFGYSMSLDLLDLVERMIYLGTYEREETGLAWRWLRPGMTFLDVGANVGYFTLLASRRVGQGGRVISVEPSPHAYDRLARVVAENGLGAVTHRIGLSDREGTCTLYPPAPGANNHTPTMVKYDGAGDPVEVPVRRLDDCLDAWGVGTVDLLKIDVEGHEGKVFEGAEGSLKSGRIKAILCEFNDYWLRETGTTPRDLHAMLTGLGFIDRAGEPRFENGCVVNRFLMYRGTPGR